MLWWCWRIPSLLHPPVKDRSADGAGRAAPTSTRPRPRARVLEATPRNVLDISRYRGAAGHPADAAGVCVRRARDLDRRSRRSAAARIRRPEAGGARGGRPADPEPRHARRQSCNASPAADGVPPLLALDARSRLRARAGGARLPLAAFITGNRRTALAPDELVTAIQVPRACPGARATFLKLGRAELSGDLHRLRGGAARRGCGRSHRRCGRRRRRLLGGAAAASRTGAALDRTLRWSRCPGVSASRLPPGPLFRPSTTFGERPTTGARPRRSCAAAWAHVWHHVVRRPPHERAGAALAGVRQSRSR